MSTTVSPAQPALGPRDQAWRLLLCVVISGLAWGEIAVAQWDEARWWFWGDLGVGLASYVVVLFRRRWPMGIAVVLTLVGLFSMSSAGPGVLAVVSLATRRRYSEIVPIGLLGVVCGQLYSYYSVLAGREPIWLVFTFNVAITIALVVIGMYIGSRRELLWSLRERARHAEAEQSLRVQQARSAERERIAREMHDVLAHRISLVAMHSGALAFRDDLPAEQVRETAALIQQTSHAALADLRQVLGALREGDVGYRPQPSLQDLGALVADARAGGMDVDLQDSVGGQPPEPIGRAAYRIVQEALTNARKHGGPKVRVTLGGRAGDGLEVTVTNGRRFGQRPDRSPASGFGLVGLRERAELAGGRIDVDETRDSFTLRGWLPWPA